jgi:hypothetical protein
LEISRTDEKLEFKFDGTTDDCTIDAKNKKVPGKIYIEPE